MSESKVVVTPVNILHYHRLYERYIFFYAVIMSVWLILAGQVFTRYKIEALSIQQNLALGLLYYVFFAAMIALTPFWFRITLYRFTETDKWHQFILDRLEEAGTQEEYDEMCDYLRQNGEVMPSGRQTLALMGIFWILIFEVYFLFAWIDPHTYALLWQPEWLKGMTQWIINHTNTDNRFLDFTFDLPNIPRSETWRDTMLGILNTPYGNTIVAVHIWFMFSFPIFLFCICKTFWYVVDWLGLERVNPKNIHSVGKFLWLSFISFFMLLIFIVFIFSFKLMAQHTLLKFATVTDISKWFIHLKIYVGGAFFFLFAVKILLGWFQFWKRIFAKIFKGAVLDN